MHLAELLKRPEGKTLEFKRDLSSAIGVLRTVSAFANTAGGTILIGVEDTTRHVRGVDDPLAMEDRLASILIDGIAPRLLPNIEVLPWRKTNILAVQVYPSPSRPHYLKSVGIESGVYVRVGSSNRRADEAFVAEMRRSSLGGTFDEQPMVDLNSESVDFRVASECFSDVRKLRRNDLETLRLLVPHQGRKVPTVGGILLFGNNRDAHFPDAWIQAGRFNGNDRTTIIDSARIDGPLPKMIEATIAFVQKHGMHGYDIGAVRRTDTWSVPAVALREAVINAVVHADFSQRGAPLRISIFDDRVEIESPGLLPAGLTVEDLRQGISKLRNRVIGRVFEQLGLIEQWGSGIQRMSTACRESGLPEPALEEIGTRFRVTLYTKKEHKPSLDSIDQALLDALANSSGRSTHDLAAVISRTPRSTRTRLAGLVGRGLVLEIGSGQKDPRRRYVRASKD